MVRNNYLFLIRQDLPLCLDIVFCSFPVEKYVGCAKTFPSCVMNLTKESRIFMSTKILQWSAAMLIVLSFDFSGELDSTVAGVVCLSLTNFTSVACLIVQSLMSLL